VTLLFVSPDGPKARLWGEPGFKFPSALAAVTPSHGEIGLVDENMEAIDFTAESDLVAITSMTPQA
jgi:hypothetical protein